MTFGQEPNTLGMMPDTHGQEKPAPVKLPFWRTAWPDIAGADSGSLRRRKFAVRAGHLAMAGPVVTSSWYTGKNLVRSRRSAKLVSTTWPGVLRLGPEV